MGLELKQWLDNTNILVILKMLQKMELAQLYGKMDARMRVYGSRDNSMAMENLKLKIHFIRVISNQENLIFLDYVPGTMVGIMMESTIWGKNKDMENIDSMMEGYTRAIGMKESKMEKEK
jgi:predicted metalloprotease with PDZ domain